MATKIAINGFGRIGRLVFRALVEQGLLGDTFEVVAINDLVPADNLAYLMKYDSVQGRFNGEVSSAKSSPDAAADDTLVVNGHAIKCLALRAMPNELPWADLGVDIVIESTGLYRPCLFRATNRGYVPTTPRAPIKQRSRALKRLSLDALLARTTPASSWRCTSSED